MKYEEDWNYARLSEFTFSYSHNLSRTRIESRDPFTYSTVISISGLVSQIILYSFPLILFLSPRNSGQCGEISISLLPLFIVDRVQTRTCEHATVFARKYLTLPREQFSSRIPEHFFLFCFLSPLICPLARAGQIFPNLFLSRTRAGKRVSLSNTLTSSSRWHDADPLVWPAQTKLQYRERGRKAIEASIRYFFPRVFLWKKK